ncbi:MAG TPA: GNAT family N-acetyltransferase [Acidimicrobiales bacterium]|nr:GNAT family N-acetyltransferase [Acidimicrobiales bacterium]
MPPGLDPPEPPLTDSTAGVALRPWRATPGDVAALVAAWADPAVAAGGRPPADRSPAAAEAWIAGAAARLDAGLALDLVVVDRGDEDVVLGEVGLRNIDRVRRRAEIGWWIGAAHRGHGRSAPAVAMVAAWAQGPPLWLRQVWARIDPANPASAAVARRAGFRRLGVAAGTEIWARSPEPRPGAATLRR